MSKAPKDLRIPIMMSSAEVEAIDEWRYANKIATRAEAVRRLCQVGIFLDGALQSLSDTFEGKDSSDPQIAAELSTLVLRILMVFPFTKAHPLTDSAQGISSGFALSVLKELENDDFRDMFAKAIRNEAARRLRDMEAELISLRKPHSDQ